MLKVVIRAGSLCTQLVVANILQIGGDYLLLPAGPSPLPCPLYHLDS